jgi:Zn-dependent peptidase ImmA (M78 family)
MSSDRAAIDSASVDAFSVWHNETPYVLLNPMKSGERGRMDISHELGHLCMHGADIARSRQVEWEAERFASAFLMPAQDVLANIPGAWSIKLIHKLKTRWKVSAIALVVRLKALGVLSEWQYRMFCIELSESGQRTIR